MTSSSAALAGYYCRLHAKLNTPGAMFDASWTVCPTEPRDQLQWGRVILQISDASEKALSFDRLGDRLLLLTPGELQQLGCAVGALMKKKHLRICIDGARLRALQSVIGPIGFAEIMRPDDRKVIASLHDSWTVESLCVDGVFELMSNETEIHPLALRFVKVGLPKNFPWRSKPALAIGGRLPLKTLRTWYPELRWLFG